MSSCPSQRERERNLKEECERNLNKLNTKHDELKSKYDRLDKNYTDLNKKYGKCVGDYKSLQSNYKTLNTNFNNLNSSYNVQASNTKGLLDNLRITETFQEGVGGISAEEQEAVYDTLLNDNVKYYNEIVDENRKLDTEIQKTKNSYSTDDQKVNYQNQQLYIVNNAIFYMSMFYFTLLAILLYYLYYNKNVSFYMKLAMIVGVLIYPYIILPFERFLLYLGKYILSFIQGNPAVRAS
jgi:DNA repair exonuclease SbcCD ATPase subunit